MRTTEGGKVRTGKRFLYDRIWRTSYFVPERTTCTRPIFVIILYLDYPTPRNFLSRTSLFFPLYSTFFLFFPSFSTRVLSLSLSSSLSFSATTLENASSASGTTFNHGPNCVARKSAPLRTNRADTFASTFSLSRENRGLRLSTRVSLFLCLFLPRLFRKRVYYAPACKYIVQLITTQHSVTFR